MTKPWEEAWTKSVNVDGADGVGLQFPDGRRAYFGSLWSGRSVQFDTECGVDSDPLDEDRAKLASAAPDMARMLLRFEWCLAPGGCPACNNLMPYEHKADCKLDDLFRKAGVR